MSTFLTPNRHGYSVRFSNFHPNLLVVASSQYYGLAGGGTLFFLELTPDGGIREINSYQWNDGLFDVVWSKQNPNVVVSASGDGSLQLWNTFDFDVKRDSNLSITPQLCYQEHNAEIYSLDWSRTRHEQLMLSASWDRTVKLWDPNRVDSLSTYTGHSQLVYNAMFSPHIPNTFASVGGDGYLKLWNTLGGMPNRPSASIKVHNGEVLTCDWSKHDENIIATGGSDGLIRGWDIRNLGPPIFELRGCDFAVRRIQFSPFTSTIIASVSYDSTTRIWDIARENGDAMEVIQHHSEFTYGLDWNNLRPNQLADCGWDSLVHVFSPKSLLSL